MNARKKMNMYNHQNLNNMNLKMIISAFAVAGLAASCGSPQLSTGINKENLDTKAKPADDFYQYACGGWMKNHPLPGDHSRYGSFDLLNENNNKQVRVLIEELAAKDNEKGSVAQKIGDLYKLAMDSVRRNKEGVKPIAQYLDMVKDVKTPADVMAVCAKLERIGMGGYFGTGVDADIKNSRDNLVQIGQGGLTLGEKEYYLDNDEATLKIRSAFGDYIIKVFRLCGCDSATAVTKAQGVLDVQTALAKVSRSATQLRDPEANYNKMTFAQLVKDYPAIDWKTYYTTCGFPEFKEISVGQPEFLHGVENILKTLPIEAHKAYLEFNIIDYAASYTNDEMRKASFDFYGRVFSGQKEEKPSWRRAVSLVQGVMGEGVGKMYVEKHFPESSKQRMQKLVSNLQVALGERIKAQTWMSEATKRKALEKLSSFYVKIGYPDKWQDYSALTIDPSLPLLDNMVAAARYSNDYEIERTVNKKVDRTKWYMYPQTVNAYYNPTTNEICFPAGILQPPFFDAEADDAFNYGAIGVVIGHEMTHGFDDQGRQFDKEGNLKDWWTKADGENFKARAQVMSDFFSGIEVLPGLKGNGALTLGENLADHGGLQVAYQALLNAMKETPLDSVDGFSPQQRFFLAYAGVWAGNISNEEIRRLTKSDPHSLGRWRVNGALPHIDAWYEAFGIKEGDSLFVPKAKRVDIW
jgi:putative endopeptidase